MTTPAPSRILEIQADAMTPEQAVAAQRLTKGPRGRIPTPYKVWLHSPHLAQYMERLGTFLSHDSSLSTREIEIAVLVIARHWGADYVLHNHAREAKDAGISAETVEAILEGREPHWASSRDTAVYKIVKAADSGATLSEADFSFVLTHLGRASIAEIVALLGYFTAVSLAMKLHAVPIPSPAV
jgi:4-carboxymuconolactone decarboxylase